jgi:hypothetical protein
MIIACVTFQILEIVAALRMTRDANDSCRIKADMQVIVMSLVSRDTPDVWVIEQDRSDRENAVGANNINELLGQRARVARRLIGHRQNRLNCFGETETLGGSRITVEARAR